jgi:hypothetical protein
MRKLTFSEIYDNGEKAFEAGDYVTAEQWFLTVLYEYSKLHASAEGYMQVLASFDKLYLDLYKREQFANKSHVLKFYEITNPFLTKAKSSEQVFKELFIDESIIPTIEILTNSPEKVVPPPVDPLENQKRQLQKIYDDALYTPVFRINKNFCIGSFKDMIPYIAYDDIMNHKYIIRGRPANIISSLDNEKRDMIASYMSIGDLVKDGWELD